MRGLIAGLSSLMHGLVANIVMTPPPDTLRKTGSLSHLALRPMRRDHYANAWGRPLKRAITVCTLVSRSRIYGALPKQVRFDSLDGYTPPPPNQRPMPTFGTTTPRPAASYRAARRNALRFA